MLVFTRHKISVDIAHPRLAEEMMIDDTLSGLSGETVNREPNTLSSLACGREFRELNDFGVWHCDTLEVLSGGEKMWGRAQT